MPEVAVWPMPKGLPMAITKSPTARPSESPHFVSTRFFGSTFNKAMSVPGSAPTSFAGSRRLSLRVMAISRASLTTCALVMT